MIQKSYLIRLFHNLIASYLSFGTRALRSYSLIPVLRIMRGEGFVTCFQPFSEGIRSQPLSSGIPFRKTSINISYSVCIFLGESLAQCFSFFSQPVYICSYKHKIFLSKILCVNRYYNLALYRQCLKNITNPKQINGNMQS